MEVERTQEALQFVACSATAACLQVDKVSDHHHPQTWELGLSDAG